MRFIPGFGPDPRHACRKLAATGRQLLDLDRRNIACQARPTHAEFLDAFGAFHPELANQPQTIDDGMD
jgi:hypothetical protein